MSDPGHFPIARALNPERSAVVEACAGSGKTWLLVARMVRALLADCAPGKLLAITYTRKAAREIEERLRESLRELATLDDARALAFLAERGLDSAAAARALPKARRLFEEMARAAPPPTITTFHGWFAATLGAAPLDTGWAGFRLVESSARLREEVWQLFGADLARRPRDGVSESVLWLLEEIGLHSTRRLLGHFLERRAEWHAYAGEDDGAFDAAVQRLAADFAVDPHADACTGALADDALRECAALLERSATKTDLAQAQSIAQALGSAEARTAMDALTGVFLTKAGVPRKNALNKALENRLGAAGAQRLVELREGLAQRCIAVQAKRAEQHAYWFTRHGLTVGQALLDAYERFKRERRLMDFVNLERHCDRLLRDPVRAAFVQVRLDARYKHILIDEFQDTNPLQWRILRAWLDGYGGAGYKPQVFVVGDPKQSIYRFRRAEPRLFPAAAAFLADAFEAERFDNDLTRRNAPAIVTVVNHLFAAELLFQPYRAQQALATQLPGRVELLPLAGHEPAPLAQAGALRNPLREPRLDEEDRRRRGEARQVVERIGAAVGRWRVIEGEGQERRERPLQYGDIMILARRRRAFIELEAELRAADIPYIGQRRGGLLDTLEAADLTALLRFLLTPADDLALAHALRAPALGASDDDLILLAAEHAEPTWWQRLRTCVANGRASPALERAARLLGEWIEMAPRVPVHDLLDRIYAESELVARTCAAVPAAMWPGVAANLEAFIALALEVDGGRFPSLPRFIDELQRLARGDAEDAPDEGLIAAADEDGGRVRLLTIHAAKGLEAPLVFLLDAHSARDRHDTYATLIDWPAKADRPAHFSLFATTKERGQRRQALFEQEEQLAAREALNLLYVAVTRARQYFFAGGIEPIRGELQGSAYERLRATLEALGDAAGHGPLPTSCSAETAPPAAPSGIVAPPPVSAPIGERRMPAGAEAAWGIRLHALLQVMTEGRAVTPANPLDIAEPAWQTLIATAESIRAAPHLQRFFDTAGVLRAQNELEFGLPDGSVGRIDRLVEFEHEVWILDYKSGRRDGIREADYRRQLGAYRAALAQIIQGKPLRCGLIYGDGELVEM